MFIYKICQNLDIIEIEGNDQKLYWAWGNLTIGTFVVFAVVEDYHNTSLCFSSYQLIFRTYTCVNVELSMKKLELELQKILRNDIELTISELTCFEYCYLLHKGSQAKWQRRENSQARQLAGTCTYLQTKCFHTSITLPVLGEFNILNFTLGNINVFNKKNSTT